MFFVRLVVLVFWVSYSWAMGHQPGGLNSLGEAISLSFLVAAPALYLLPTYEAWSAKRENLASIATLNLLLGWSILGWVAAAVWALKTPRSERGGAAAQKKCPLCAEDVHIDAIKCKHCGSDISPQTP